MATNNQFYDLFNRSQALLGAVGELRTAVRDGRPQDEIHQLVQVVYRIAVNQEPAESIRFVPPYKSAELVVEMDKILTGALDEAEFEEADFATLQKRFDRAAALARELVREQAAESIDALYPPLKMSMSEPPAPELVKEEDYFTAIQAYAVNNYAAPGWKFQNGMAETVRQWYREGIPYSFVFEALDVVAAKAPGDPAGPVFTHHYTTNRLVRQAWVRAGRPSIHRAVVAAEAERQRIESYPGSVSERLRAGAARLRAEGAIKLSDGIEAIAQAVQNDPSFSSLSMDEYDGMIDRHFSSDLPEPLRGRFLAEVDRKLRGLQMLPSDRENTRRAGFLGRARRHFGLSLWEVFS